jgi:hypothetical protein
VNGAALAAPHYRFPAADCSRIPYGMYLDADIYALEQIRIFHGPRWKRKSPTRGISAWSPSAIRP